MPAPNKAPLRTSRRGHYSCEFCRARKLRCSRPIPCTNCVARGKKCVLVDTDVRVEPVKPSTIVAVAEHQQPHQQQPQQPPEDLLREVQRLKQLAHDLEQRIAQGGTTLTVPPSSRGAVDDAAVPLPGAAPYSPASSYSTQAPPLPVLTPATTPADSLSPIGAVVTHLDRVSMGKGSYEPPVWSGRQDSDYNNNNNNNNNNSENKNGLVVKIEHVHAIPTAPAYSFNIVNDRLDAPARCVYLPQYRQTLVLLNPFLQHVNYLYHIVHHPSLPDMVRNLYDSVQRADGQQPLPLGHIVLLLAIIATGTYLYSPPTGDGMTMRNGTGDDTAEAPLFPSRRAAAEQTSMWIQTALNVLDAVLRGPAPPTLEAVQGIITLSFLVGNVDGVAFRYRYLVSTGLLLARELGLHCLDHASTSAAATASWNPVEREIGRRVWWYLASTDWLLAARHNSPGVAMYQTHPHLMRVNEPRNIDDTQLTACGPEPPDQPLAQPTGMSYFLQRLRLGKITRTIIDQALTAPGSSSSPFLSHPLLATTAASNAALDQMLRDLPPFFRLETYGKTDEDFARSIGHRGGEDGNTDGDSVREGIFIQAYMLHALIHTQRCKLHLSYLTSCQAASSSRCSTTAALTSTATAPAAPASSSSRAICIDAARQIIRAEAMLKRCARNHPFVKNRLTCTLYGVFLASIVLLVDLCAALGEEKDGDNDDVGGGDGDKARHGNRTQVNSAQQQDDAREALRIVADASGHSPSAAELYAALTQLVAKYRPRLLLPVPAAMSAPVSTAGPAPDWYAAPTAATDFGVPAVTPAAATMPPLMASQQLPNANALPPMFDGFDDFNNFQWDDLLSGVDSSLFL
ncbi:Zn(2)-C6 fungal-type DNA-binding domain protein [Niveomyces insectorum RCEF 264]|uniref:Zn(2)-C6 fungal-type DNA-binding domain protein n=1 Tax=Niveomyces insectorum RCEF 264 TaxID=1081102 RepID=A0A167W905_9HYPO|nr:Zn(2)-C6 fungal-type DNA-binding domain protein [Niveomyces insectorum RCEF 264]